MKRLTPRLIAIAILVSGCMQDRAVLEITCQPQFESKLLPELVVTGPGGRVDARELTLVLSHEGMQYRFPWGTPPVSQSPVALFEGQTYTFTLDTTGTELLSIHEGQKLIYENPSPAPDKQ